MEKNIRCTTEFDMGDRSLQRSWSVLKSRQTGLLPFALTNIGDYTCDSHYYTRRQGMEECLLLYTLEGEGSIQYEDREFVLPPGHLVLLDCRKLHYYATRGERWHFLWVHFAGKCAFDYAELLNSEGTEAIFVGKRYSFQNEFDKLIQYARFFDVQSELEAAATLQKLLTDLIGLKKRDIFSLKYGDYRKNLEDSLFWIQNHFREEITVEQLAEICHLSKFYFIKVFRAYTGQTPYDYLVGFRVVQSQRMLLTTGMTVAQVAAECGFSDSKNFIACFKKRAGMTPLQYRKYIRPAGNKEGTLYI